MLGTKKIMDYLPDVQSFWKIRITAEGVHFTASPFELQKTFFLDLFFILLAISRTIRCISRISKIPSSRVCRWLQSNFNHKIFKSNFIIPVFRYVVEHQKLNKKLVCNNPIKLDLHLEKWTGMWSTIPKIHFFQCFKSQARQLRFCYVIMT